jgi:hypothetical protein
MLRVPMLSLALLIGCAPNIRPLYEAEAAAAGRVVRDVPPAWDPDLRVQFSTVSMQDAVREGVAVALEELPPVRIGLPMGASATVAPSLALQGMAVTPSQACEGCLSYATSLQGDIRVAVLGSQVAIPVDATLLGTVQVAVEKARVVVVRPHAVDRVRVSVRGVPALVQDPSGAVQELIRGVIARHLPVTELYSLEGTSLPVRALDVHVAPDGVELRMLSDAPGSAPVGPGPMPAAGVRVRASNALVVALARREAFAAGPVMHEIVADPRGLRLDGEHFAMDLRLWRLSGKGWWRDYDIRGTLAVKGGEVRVNGEAATPAGHSPRAGLADPLSAAVAPFLAGSLQRAVSQALPGSHTEVDGGIRFSARLRTLTGESGAWIADADVGAERASPPADKPKGFGRDAGSAGAR